MTDRKLLELAPGSRWSGDCVIDRHGDSCYAYESPGGHAVECHESAYAQDLIVLLHRAGLLDELMCAVWSMAIARAVVQLRNHGSDGCASLVDELHAQNPYLPRKGES